MSLDEIDFYSDSACEYNEDEECEEELYDIDECIDEPESLESISEEIDYSSDCMLQDNEIIDEVNEETNEINYEDNTSYIMRAVLDQNVEEQRLPSGSRFTWSGEEGMSKCTVSDDAVVRTYDKVTGEYEEKTGEEYKEEMIQNYGVDCVEYIHKEPDFAPFEHQFSKDKLEVFLTDMRDEPVEFDEGEGLPEGHWEIDEMSTDRTETFGKTYDYYIDKLGNDITKDEFREYLKENNLTIHECGDRRTIRLVPTDINQVYAHTGGIGIEKDFEVLSDGVCDIVGEKYILDKDSPIGNVEGTDDAIEARHEWYHERKKST